MTMFKICCTTNLARTVKFAHNPITRWLNVTVVQNDSLQPGLETPKEITVPMPYGHIAGKWWGSMNDRPMLAIHGWQDNAGSFDNLIPLLSPNISILAIDLPGHGRSSSNPPGVYYHYFNSCFVIRRIVKYFGWKSVSLLSHSMGSTGAYMYVASFPNEVERYIGLDALRPFAVSHSTHVSYTAKYMEKYLDLESKVSSKGAPSYTYEELVNKMIKESNGSYTHEACDVLFKRGAEKVIQQNGEVRYKLLRDPLVKFLPLLRPSHELILEYARKITCPVLYIKAKEGFTFESPHLEKETMDLLRKVCKKMEYHEIHGTHHVHLNNPERVAPILNEFLNST